MTGGEGVTRTRYKDVGTILCWVSYSARHLIAAQRHWRVLLFVSQKRLHNQAPNQRPKSRVGRGSFHLLTFSKSLIVMTVVRLLCTWGIRSKTSVDA